MKRRNIVKGFPDRLGRAIYVSELTTIQIAAIIGCERKSISNWQNGVNCPSAYYLAKLSELLNVSADYLLFEEERK